METPTHHLREILILRLLALTLPVWIASCSVLQPKDDPTHHYVLRSLSKESQRKPIASNTALTISVGPVAVPTYLDRNQLVSRIGNNELKVEEFHIWGESLDRGISRVVSRNLAHLLDTPAVAPYPEIDLPDNDYRVSILVNRFESVDDRHIILDCIWAITKTESTNSNLLRRASRITIPFESSTPTENNSVPDKQPIVAAMSQALQQLSVAIAQKLRP